MLAVTDASGALISEQRYLPFGEVREDVGEITQTDFGYTFQRGLPGTGLMDYRARFYAPYLNRFTQPDTIVPEPGNPQALNRYSYTLNNPINYNDPTGHLTEKEICKYFGYCDRKSAEAGLGEKLFKLLWNKKITWGDTIILGYDENDTAIQATLVLFANTDDNSLSAALWNIETGERVQWSAAREAKYIAAYNEQNDAWYSSDQSGNEWCNRDSCTAWAGGTPTTHTAEDLFVKENYVGYGLSNYYDLDGMAYAELVFGLITLPNPLSLPQKISLAVSLAFMADAVRNDLAPEATYPIVSFINAHTSPPWYVPLFGFTPTP